MDLVVGRVVKSHGVRGEVVVDVRTDDPDTRFAVGSRLRGRLPKGRGESEYVVESARDHSGRLLLALAGIDDRARADDLRGLLFLIDSAAVDSGDDPDEFYDHELEGVAVTTRVGDAVGVVAEILHLPGGDTLVVKTDAGAEILVPFVTEIVPIVSTSGIVIDPPDGLLELQ
ncbi:ribosome maturation factor RimM [Williamsia sp. CHRR-6]|uniref:ribosome maturation factor RimM n=1 Tax=Williamsia sp. CHRR-6 TaxID=2835871 RepID=UPI001BDB3F7F|nr:ribosome maturation factor RimM [Williamsia sp. CHRR-6]MBT0568363.1 ribosome maturation factor RimM [Williamsia sp. CHRR-6]